MTRFETLKSQEEIEAEARYERGYDWFKWYMIISGTISAIFYLLAVAALGTYVYTTWFL